MALKRPSHRWFAAVERLLWVALGGHCVAAVALAVAPSVNPGGVVNNASYLQGPPKVAPGMLAAVFGQNLTNGSSCVAAQNCFQSFDTTGQLFTTMAGAQVTIDGRPVPIFYATPTQLGIQIPYDLTASTATIQVFVNSEPSAPQTIGVAPFAPGIFTTSQDGTGPGAITHADGRPVDANNPAVAGEVLIMYATGLGQVTPPVGTGRRPVGTTSTVTLPTVTIDGIPAVVQFAGLSNCCVGLNQINVVVPPNVRLGPSIPVVLSIGGVASNVVTISTAPASILTASLTSINFGEVSIGSSAARSVTLTNGGATSLTIATATLSAPEFQITGLTLPLTLPAGEGTSFAVTFTPRLLGNVTGNLTIASDAQNSVVIALSGSGGIPLNLTILTSSMPSGSPGVPYNGALSAAGGRTPYTWS
ncbi:MAG TPA: choice-of-anchor D domain-containing protein, partial [Terriglobia bacterium]|nr:choice-of-anchor D domain-containing protein [Terriglobia bacterium]